MEFIGEKKKSISMEKKKKPEINSKNKKGDKSLLNIHKYKYISRE